MTDDAFRRVDALIQVGMRLARSAPSGRILLKSRQVTCTGNRSGRTNRKLELIRVFPSALNNKVATLLGFSLNLCVSLPVARSHRVMHP